MDTTVVDNPNLENVAAMTVVAWSTRMQISDLTTPCTLGTHRLAEA